MSLAIEIVTPEKPLLAEPADFVVVPAVDGELGILPEHIALLAELQPGEIRIRTGASEQRIAVSGGFVQVRPHSRVTIFAETAEMAQEIDVERARQAAEKAREVLQSRPPDVDLAAIEASLRRALVRLKVSEAVRRHSGGPPRHV